MKKLHRLGSRSRAVCATGGAIVGGDATDLRRGAIEAGGATRGSTGGAPLCLRGIVAEEATSLNDPDDCSDCSYNSHGITSEGLNSEKPILMVLPSILRRKCSRTGKRSSNYKPLNEGLKWIRYPIPNKKDLINRLYKACIFSKFDMKSGYW
ncbi:hypothetical protein JRO89_XS02G0239400 [Xanthoceras sorbifolium]|uniref:Uncharacterized protein n=1 Tax=Xanthoceras sorbifolium TaxID=99658 RepID=A0ABQ8IHH3_9ROSI|nr:hypothetical protein JRO89_XS02G0239400 [Xanthoceras sorbifolium]